MSKEQDRIYVHRPFGPVFCEFSISQKTIINLNKWVDDLSKNSDLRKKLNYGKNLAGQVTEEILVPEEIGKQGIGPELSKAIQTYILNTTGKNMKKLEFMSIWIVRQYGGEYNPIHYHGGHLSGAGWLKLPSVWGAAKQEDKKYNYNGKIQFIHGSRMFNCKSEFTIEPKVGKMFIFPAYLMQTVYPFYGDEERRSIAFNARIDEELYNVYSTKV